MIDLHTHLLPGVDDGAQTTEQAAAVLGKFHEYGVTTVCCTPHLKASELAEAPCEDLDELLKELAAAAPVAPKLVRIKAQGLIPLLAHPERYAVCSVEQAARWREAGAVLQIDATTLLTDTKRAERARDLLTAGYGTIIASDNHGDGRSMAAAVEWMESHGAREQARLLAYENPSAILSDVVTMDVPPVRLRRSWYSMLKDFVIGGKDV